MFGSVTVSGLSSDELLQEQRNHRAARGHHVAVARRRKHRLARVAQARLGDHHLLHHGLGHAHGVDRINGLVRAEQDAAAHAVRDRRAHHVLCTEYIGPHSLHRIELAGRHLLERRRVEDVVDAAHARRARCRNRARLRYRTSLCRSCSAIRMSSCFFSSRLNMRTSLKFNFSRRATAAFPNEPVPPVIRTFILSNIPIPQLCTYSTEAMHFSDERRPIGRDVTCHCSEATRIKRSIDNDAIVN